MGKKKHKKKKNSIDWTELGINAAIEIFIGILLMLIEKYILG